MKTEDLLFGLFATFGERGLSASALIGLAEPLGITATNVRTHLSRMGAKGLIEKSSASGSGLYRVGKRGSRITDRVGDKLKINELDPWDGDWIMVSVSFPKADPTAKAQMRRRLHWYGFVQRQAGLYIRPCWPAWDWPEKIHSLSRVCRMEIIIGQWFPFSPLNWRQLWPQTDAFSEESKTLLAEIEISERIKADDARQRHKQRFQMGNRFYPLVAADLLLPVELFPQRKIFQQLKDRWREYDQIAHSRSLPFIDTIIRRIS